MTESESDIRITTDTPYLTLMDELWGIYWEDLGENWPRYNGTALYTVKSSYVVVVFSQSTHNRYSSAWYLYGAKPSPWTHPTVLTYS